MLLLVTNSISAFLVCGVFGMGLDLLWVFLLLGRSKSDIPEFMNHVALGMPMLVLAISEDFDELLKDGCLAAIASLSELCRIMVMAINLSIVLIITVLRPKDRRTH